ncbi:15656_t:CDS:1, partial [Dentiscutata erythropus]
KEDELRSWLGTEGCGRVFLESICIRKITVLGSNSIGEEWSQGKRVVIGESNC